MLSHISGRAAILATKRQSLHKPEYQNNRRRQQTNRIVAGNKSNCKRRSPHEDQRGQKSFLSSNRVTPLAEKQCTKRSHDETCCERGKRGEERSRRIRLR